MMLLVASCGDPGVVADDVAPVPPVEVIAETPGDWTSLALAEGKTPAESDLLIDSAISVDLNALLGPDINALRSGLARASVLRREGRLLYTIGERRDSWLVIDAADHALAAGIRQGGAWKRFTTAGADVPLPPAIAELAG